MENIGPVKGDLTKKKAMSAQQVLQEVLAPELGWYFFIGQLSFSHLYTLQFRLGLMENCIILLMD